jgi:hypothetical protein
MCMTLSVGRALLSGVHMRLMISWIRTDASGPMMCAPEDFEAILYPSRDEMQTSDESSSFVNVCVTNAHNQNH